MFKYKNNKGWGTNLMSPSGRELTQAIDSGDFPEFISEVLEAGVKSAFLEALVGRELTNVGTMSSPVQSWLREDGFDADYIGEMVEPPQATIRHSKYTIRAVKLGMSLMYSAELVEDVDFDIIGSRIIPKVGRAIAKAEDKYIMNQLLNRVADGSSDFMSGEYVDNHVLDATDAQWTTSGVLDHEKLSVALYILEKEGYNASHIVMSPAQRAQLNMLSPFYGANAWAGLTPSATKGIEDASVKSDIGIPKSSQLVISNNIPDDQVLFLNKAEYANFWIRRPLTITEQPKTPNEIFKTSYTERVACAVVEPGAGVLLDNLDYLDPSLYVG
jgi:hypothetical protein